MNSYRPKQIWLLLLGLTAAAFALRLLHLWAVSDTPWIERYWTAPSGDDYAFFQWAQTILAGDWLGRDTYHPYFKWMLRVGTPEEWHRWWGGKEIFHQTPLFPYLLALLLALYQGSVPMVFVTQLLLGSLQILVIYALAKRVFDYRVGLVAAVVTAFYGPFIFYQSTLLRDWLPPILEPLVMLAVLKATTSDHRYTWGLAGVTLGIAVLCKPTALLLGPVALIAIGLNHDNQWRVASRSLALLVVAFLLVLAPLFIRNVLVGAPVFALSTRATEAFVLANNTDNTVQSIRKVLEPSRGKLWPAFQKTLTLYHGQAVSFFGKQATKIQRVAAPYESPNNTSFYYASDLSPILRWTLGYGFVFPLGLTGLLMCLRHWRHHLLMFLYALASLVTLLLASPISRYRLVLVPVLIVYASALLIHWVDDIRARRAMRALGVAGLVLTCVLGQRLLDARQHATFANDYYNAAVAYRKRDNLPEAIREISTLAHKLATESPTSKAAHEATGMEGDYRAEWAKQLILKEKKSLAIEQIELAAAAYAKDPKIVLSHFNVGVLYVGVGEFDKARRSLHRFLRVAPENPKTARAKDLLASIEKHRE